MRKAWPRIHRFLFSDDGPTSVEYAVMLALILLVCLGAIRTFGSSAGKSLSNSAKSIAS